MGRPTIAVIGAGIAGLTAAIAFARHDAEVAIIEQAEVLSAVGAGLQLSPNATALLDRLGLLQDIEPHWHEPDTIRLTSGTTLRRLAEVPVGPNARRRWGAPYGLLHRAALQTVLLAHAVDARGCRLLLGRRASATSPAALRAEIGEIIGRSPDLIVGADGVRSAVRSALPGGTHARFSGDVAWRMLAETTGASDLLDTRGTTAFLGPASHLVAYPLAGDARLTNLVAVAHGLDKAPTPDGVTEDDAARQGLLTAFRAWHPRVRGLVATMREATPWPLFEVPDGAWTADDDIVLIGDSAHAMMPFAAQGAAQAIEDAYELAEAFCRRRGSWADALPAYVARRKGRVAAVRRRTAFNRFAYHARGPVRLARDLLLATRRPESLAADLDWLYGYRPPE
ncbi:MAG: FAD-dependent monooxygenase [Pararhizobium sp.]